MPTSTAKKTELKKPTAAKKSSMSAEHKAALAQGREEGRSVRLYLEALEAMKPRRGRRRTPDAIKKKLASLEQESAGADALSRLRIIQEQRDLQAELANSDQSVDVTELEKDFVKVAKAYGARKGIEYTSWRAAGVSAGVLQEAGISRARG